MAKESKGYGWPILGIVAIVAVVGLVIMFTQKTAVAPTLTEEEQALAGEATKIGTKLLPESGLVFKPSSEILKFYGDRGLDPTVIVSTKSGKQMCRDMGYNGCLFAGFRVLTTFYEGNAGSCSGEVQMQILESRLDSCDLIGLRGYCGTSNSDAEPKTGDSYGITNIQSVVCTK